MSLVSFIFVTWIRHVTPTLPHSKNTLRDKTRYVTSPSSSSHDIIILSAFFTNAALTQQVNDNLTKSKSKPKFSYLLELIIRIKNVLFFLSNEQIKMEKPPKWKSEYYLSYISNFIQDLSIQPLQFVNYVVFLNHFLYRFRKPLPEDV